MANEAIRLRITRGVFATTSEGYSAFAPGDVIEVDRKVANSILLGNRGERVAADTPLVRQKDYLPERKRSQIASDLANAKAEVARLEALAKATGEPVKAEKKSA